MKTITIKQAVKFGLYIMFPVTMGLAIVSMPGLSASAWMKKIAPAVFLGFLLCLVHLDGLSLTVDSWKNILKFPGKKDLDVRLISFLAMLSVACSFFIIHNAFGVTITLSLLLAGIGIVTSYILLLSDKQSAGLALFIITLPIIHFLEFQFRVFHNADHGIFFIMPSIVIMWGTLILFLCKFSLSKRSFVKTPFNKVWLMIFTAMVLSAVFSSDRIVSFRHVFYFISTSIPFFLAANIIKTTKDLKLCVISLAVAGAVRTLTILYFELGKMSAGFAYDPVAHSSLPSYHAVLGLGTALSFFLTITFIAREKLTFKKGLLISLPILLLLITLLKLPRSVDIAILCGILVVFLFHRVRVWILAGLIALLLTFFIYWPFLMENTSLGRFTDFQTVRSLVDSQRFRVDAYKASILMIKDHPIFGIGPGMWDEYYFKYMGDRVEYIIDGILTTQYIRGAHNIFLQHGVCNGIIGLFGMVVLFYTMVKSTISSFVQGDETIKKIAIFFLVITVFCWIMWSLGGGAFEITRSPEEHFWFWIFVGMIAAAKNTCVQKSINFQEGEKP